MAKQPFDSLIFDMDGTLWDAVDSYVTIWNKTFTDLRLPLTVSRDTLLRHIGLPLDQITASLLPGFPERNINQFYARLAHNDSQLMPILGGRLYPGVARWIPALAERYKLFMVSNCGPEGLKNFLSFTSLAPYFTDTLTNGENHLPKAENITIIANRNNLSSPLYIGDTQGDCDQAHRATIPMLHVTYGFGNCHNPDMTADSFDDLAKILL